MICFNVEVVLWYMASIGVKKAQGSQKYDETWVNQRNHGWSWWVPALLGLNYSALSFFSISQLVVLSLKSQLILLLLSSSQKILIILPYKTNSKASHFGRRKQEMFKKWLKRLIDHQNVLVFWPNPSSSCFSAVVFTLTFNFDTLYIFAESTSVLSPHFTLLEHF